MPRARARASAPTARTSKTPSNAAFRSSTSARPRSSAARSSRHRDCRKPPSAAATFPARRTSRGPRSRTTTAPSRAVRNSRSCTPRRTSTATRPPSPTAASASASSVAWFALHEPLGYEGRPSSPTSRPSSNISATRATTPGGAGAPRVPPRTRVDGRPRRRVRRTHPREHALERSGRRLLRRRRRPQTAGVFREFGDDLDDQLERAETLLEEVCSDADDRERAQEAATGAIEAAYEEYVENLEAMGANPKPVC